VTPNDANHILNRFEAETRAELYKSRWDTAHAASVVPNIIACLHLADTAVLHRALSALICIGPEAHPAIDSVIPLMSHSDVIIADTAMIALSCISLRCPERAIVPLVQAASKPATQKSALFALIRLGRGAISAAPCFIAAFENSDARIRRLALRGLKEVGAEASIIAQLASRALKDSNAQVRNVAERLLAFPTPVTTKRRHP
jgi:hypothetical protein